MASTTEKDTARTRGLRSTLLGVIANAFLVVVKLIGGLAGNSYALVADAAESALDIFGSLVVLSGLRIGAIPPDEDHPYGHGKAEALAALFIALLLIGVAIALAIASVNEILVPHHSPAPFTLIILVVVVAVKEGLFRFVLNVGESLESTVVQADAWHHRSDALTSAAAFIGISVALVMGPGYEAADDWAALVACAIIAFNGYNLARPALAEVMDAVPKTNIEPRVRQVALGTPNVLDVEKCRVRKYGLNYIVDLHVHVDGNLTVHEGHRIAHEVKDRLLAADLNVRDVLVHIEPAVPPTQPSSPQPPENT